MRLHNFMWRIQHKHLQSWFSSAFWDVSDFMSTLEHLTAEVENTVCGSFIWQLKLWFRLYDVYQIVDDEQVTCDWGPRSRQGHDDAESDWKLVVSRVTFPGSSDCICCSESSFYLQHNFKKHNTPCSTTSLFSLMAVPPFYLSPPSVNHLMLSLSLSLRSQTPADLQLCSHKAAVFLSHQLIAVNCIHLLAPVWISL